MNNKLHKIAIATLMTLIIGIFSINAFGQLQPAKINQLIIEYDNAAARWIEYRDQQVAPYYNHPTYYRWARSEYQRANQQISSAQQYAAYYRNMLSQQRRPGGNGFSGTFYSSEGYTYTFQQNGNQIEGRYGKGNDWGVIRGSVSGNRLRAFWNNSSGMINGEHIIILRSDGNIEGKYCFNQGCDPTKGTYFTATRQ